jgi:hypothetical protein
VEEQSPSEEPKMGETRSGDLLKEEFDKALSEPETETEVVEETQETEAPAPDALETEETEEAVQETETTTDLEEEVDRLAPLITRLRSGKASDNDVAEIRRHYSEKNAQKEERDALQAQYEEAQRRLAELEGQDTFSAQAERIFDSVKDPKTRQNHEEFRATHTDQEYVLAVERQKAEDQYRDPPPEEDPRDKALREMQYRLDQIEKGNQARAAEESKALLEKHTIQALGELKVPEKYHDFLSAIVIDARNASVTPVNTYAQLRELTKGKWGVFEPILKSERTTEKESLIKKTTKVVQEEEEIPEAVSEDELDKFEDSTKLLKKGLDEAERGFSDSGAA